MLENEKKEFMLTLRPYQTEILLKAFKHNTIVFLPFGLGKTYIATALVKLFSPDTEKKICDGGKRSIVLVDTAVLQEKVTKRIEKQCGLLTGAIDDEAIAKPEWDSEQLDSYQVLIITPKIFRDMLVKRFIAMRDINLIVINECHQALTTGAIQQIMDFYEDAPYFERPRLLGLTAGLLNCEADLQRIGYAVRKLEKVLKSNMACVENIKDLKKFIGNPTMKFVPYDEPIKCDILTKLDSHVQNIVRLLDEENCEKINLNLVPLIDEKNLLRDKALSSKFSQHLVHLCDIIKELGVYGGHIAASRMTMYFQRSGSMAEDEDEKMVYLTFVRLAVMCKEMMAYTMASTDAKMRICKFSNSKILALLSILKEYKQNNDRCIIFVKKRSTGEILALIIKAATQYIRGFSFKGVDLFTEVGIDPYSNKRRFAEDNANALERFQSGEIDILITTDLLNEGIIEPICKLVLRYEMPTSYRDFVLSQGWSCLENSHYIVLIPENRKENDWKKISEYRLQEDQLRAHLIGCLCSNSGYLF